MEQRGESTIHVPRGMIFGLMFAVVPGFAAVVNAIGDPRLHATRASSASEAQARLPGGVSRFRRRRRLSSKAISKHTKELANRTLAASDFEKSRRQPSTV